MTITVIQQPQNATVGLGSDAYYQVLAESSYGTGETITYQWYETTAGLLAGETNYSLTVANVTSGDSGNSYYCDVTDTDGTVSSSTATLTVYDGTFQITQQPQNASVTEGSDVSFTCTATRVGLTTGPYSVTYQWYETTAGLLSGETSKTLTLTGVSLAQDDNGYYCICDDGTTQLQTNTAKLDVYSTVVPTPPPPNGPRTALVWNWENSTWTWMDASHAVNKQLEPVVCMNYGFDPGWYWRWQGWLDAVPQTTWSDLLTDDTRWADLSFAADEKNVYWLSANNLLKSDQQIEVDNGKEYFVQREKLDLDDMIPDWTSDSLKHLRQFYFHIKSTLPSGYVGWNTFDLSLGWSFNLMDDPDWNAPITVTLNKTSRGGKYKADLRTTGRYLSFQMTFNDTQAFQMTGGDLDAEEAHAR